MVEFRVTHCVNPGNGTLCQFNPSPVIGSKIGMTQRSGSVEGRLRSRIPRANWVGHEYSLDILGVEGDRECTVLFSEHTFTDASEINTTP